MGAIWSNEADHDDDLLKPTIQDYQPLKDLGEGGYGYVYEAKDLNTGDTVAIKRVDCDLHGYGIPLSCRREIDILSSCHLPNIIGFKTSIIDHDLGSVFIVMEHASTDLALYLNIKRKLLGEHAVKRLMLQLLRGVCYLHSNKIVHRDLKPDNLLLNDKLELKICDFGLSKRLEVQDGECDELSQMVVSRWYRSPELLLGKEKYTTAIDVWSVGCIMAEMVTKKVLFPGSSDKDQLNGIYSMMGSPELEMDLVGHGGIRRRYDRLRTRVPASVLSDEGFDLLSRLLELNPGRRISARDALTHPWFVDFSCF